MKHHFLLHLLTIWWLATLWFSWQIRVIPTTKTQYWFGRFS